MPYRQKPEAAYIRSGLGRVRLLENCGVNSPFQIPHIVDSGWTACNARRRPTRPTITMIGFQGASVNVCFRLINVRRSQSVAQRLSGKSTLCSTIPCETAQSAWNCLESRVPSVHRCLKVGLYAVEKTF